MARVALCQTKPNTNEGRKGRTVPLRQPCRGRIWVCLPPVSKLQIVDVANQLGFGRRGRRANWRLMMVWNPGHDHPAELDLDRDVRALPASDSGWQLTDEGDASRLALEADCQRCRTRCAGRQVWD